jgi:4,5:9,10-diseco-3-hydroxy-5,9,17-trioxoandrosta-1(10),2-diene-4-oate hydrolase
MAATPIPEAHYADLGDGARMHYHEAGEGPPVVFVHGSGPGGSGYSNFQQNFPAFAEAGHRALVPDLLGYGLSSKPTDAQYTLGFHTDGLVRFLDALGVERTAVVGNSLGGAVAMRLALDHPDRVSRLILMAPGGLEARETYMGMRGIRRMLKCIFGPDGITREGMRKVFELQLYDPAPVTDALIEARYRVALTQPRAVFETSRVPNMADEVARIACPVFTLWGADDQFCPVGGATTLAERVPNHRTEILSGCGHWVMVERRDLFNRLCVDVRAEG